MRKYLLNVKSVFSGGRILVLLLLISGSAFGQKLQVKGTITDAVTSETLIGVNVVIDGTFQGTVSDIDGNYSIAVDDGQTLVFTYVGFLPEKIEVSGQTKIDVKLQPDVLNLEDVVVVGYTTQKKKDLSGAVSVVDMEEVGKTNHANVLQALPGRAAGVTVSQDGQPGSGRTNITIRGTTTLNNNTPLYVIDGIPSQENLNNLNPNDIASIQVLKDAAAASIYGSRSAGGVIVITTKKGTKGKISVDAGATIGIQTISNKIELLDATQWGEVYWTASENAGIKPSHDIYGDGPEPVIPAAPYLIPNGNQIYQFTEQGTNWYDEVYQNALQQQYYVNVSQGTKKGSYLFGFSYFDQDGLIKETYYDRITARINTSFNIVDWIQIGENFSMSYSDQVQIGSQQGQDGIPMDVLRQHPILPVYDVRGNYAGKISGLPDVRNMVSVLEKNKDNTTDNWRLFGNAYIEANIFDAISSLKDKHDLIFKSNFGLEYGNYYSRIFEAKYQEGDYDIQDNALTNVYGTGTTLTWTNTLEYNYVFKKHNLKVIAGIESIRYEFKDLSGRRNTFEIEDPSFTYLMAGAGESTNFGTGTEWGLYSQFGRIDYTFADKYLFTGTIRYDQTSRLNTAGFFPAASIAWRLTEEGFMKRGLENSNLQNVFTEIKLRVSYGEQGNQNVGDFSTLSLFGADPNHADYDIGGTNNDVMQGYIVLTKGNPNLVWETTRQINGGFDLGMFNSSFNISFDYYVKNTEDILLRAPQIAATGEGADPWVNAASVANNGFDLNIEYKLYKPKSGFSFGANLIFDMYKNEVTSLGNDIAQIGTEGEEYLPGGDGPTRITVGKPIGVFYGYKTDGIFQSQEDVDNHTTQNGAGIGRIKYADVNGDGVISEADRTYIGDPHPTFSIGLNLNAGYKGFELTIFMFSSIGQEVFNETKWYTDFAQSGNFNHGASILDAWSPENTGSSIPAPTLTNDNNENVASDYYIETATFLKFRNIRLSYDFPEKWVKNYKVRLFAEIQNAYTITDYTGIDPEVPYAANVNYPGIDRGVYPLPRTYMFGINLNF